MNRRLLMVTVLVGLFLGLAAFAGPATARRPAQAVEVKGRVVTGDGLRVRVAPNNTSAQIGLLKTLTLVTVLGKNTNNTWLLIRSDAGLTGWAGAAYIQITQGSLKDVPVADETAAVGTAAPAATAAPTEAGATEAATETPCPPEGTPGAVSNATPVAATGVQAIVNTDGLRVRTDPSNTSAQIGLLKKATHITVLGRNSSGTWVLVKSDTITGWVGMAYILVTSGKLADVPVTDSSSAATEEPVAATEDASQAATPCPPAEGAPGATPVAATGVKGRVVSTDGLRLRTKPSNTSAQIALLKPLTLVTVIGKNANNTWLLIQTDTGLTGWAGAAFIQLTGGNLKDVPVADETAPVSTPPAS